MGVALLTSACASAAGQSGQSLGEVICGAPDSSAVWESGDTVGVLLSEAAALVEVERRAFRHYQATHCRECDFLFGMQSEFFASSSAFVRRIALDHASDPRAQCAWGDALLRRAALGEGEFDRDVLVEAARVLRQALGLEPPPRLRVRIEELLQNAEHWLSR